MYDVAIFNSDGDLVTNGHANLATYTFDYLSPEKNTVNIRADKLSDIDYMDILHMDNGIKKIVGFITTVDLTTDKTAKLTYISPLGLLEQKIAFDTRQQSTNNFLNALINLYISYIVADDSVRPAKYVQTNAGSHDEIKKWYFNLKPDNAGTIPAVIDLWSSLCVPALVKFGRVVTFDYDANAKTLFYNTDQNTTKKRTIEADLKNVISKKFDISTEVETNKVTIWNQATYYNIVYYLDGDGTITKTPKNKRRPLVQETVSVQLQDGDNFEQKAKEEASKALETKKYNHRIELEFLLDDKIIEPLKWEIGDPVNIIYGDKVYDTIYTGYEISDTITMKFGSVRNEITKRLRGIL